MNRRRALMALGSGLGVTVGSWGLYQRLNHSSGRSRSAPTRDGQVLHGISPAATDRDRMETLAAWLDAPPATVVVYANLGWSPDRIETFHDRLTQLWGFGIVPQVTLQPFFSTAEETDADVASAITAGDYDDRLAVWRTELTDWLTGGDRHGNDRRLYINLAPEMNGDWVPWGAATGDTTPSDFVAMWDSLQDRLTSDEVESHHVQWIWAPNMVSRDDNPLSAHYPGDDAVDWLAFHGYNRYQWGGWNDPATLYDGVIDALRSIADKPIAISEYGCSSRIEDEYHPDRKAEWIERVFEYFRTRDVRMACWFNVEDETDWGVFDGERGTHTWTHDGETYDVYEAYRKAVVADQVLPAHPDHARRLTDEEFQGAF
ncbi:hypothetical protein BV210_03635 [Halorientalis sp. IM1011]|uniref:glycoside hydrolase family 26 protein n=1 Tax=Halorientalis sp. IM1011 TaxID=1932360 RepID=UPI00097CCB2A|nr:glycosyl hydrolase [Halorientalis sp. IM1011]AQL41863.1 hypothetical protein BV210_03635 [Halorientalis sp. IM1011]